MTDTNNAAGAPGEGTDEGLDGVNRQARLANLLSNRAVGFDLQPTQTNITPPRPNLRYASHSNEIVNMDTGQRINADSIPAPSMNDTGRLYDDPSRSLDGTYREMSRQLDQYSDRLNAHSFDGRTGEKVYHVQGAERAALLKEAKAFEKTFHDETVILNRLAIQRAQDKEAQRLAWIDAQAVEARLVERAAERAFEIEAEERARAMLATKKNRQGG